MYCDRLLWRRLMYSSVIKNPASYCAVAAKVYVYLPSGVFRRSRPASRLTTWTRNPRRDFPMRGVTIHVSNPKRSTACTKALKKKPYTRGAAPSLMRMRAILLKTALAQEKFFTTVGQLSSTANINRPRYLKEVTISRGRP